MKRYLSAMGAVCLVGMALAVLGFFLMSRSMTSYAAPGNAPADVPDLIINVQAVNENVLADSVISYTLLYTNTLGSSLSDVIISATLSPKQFYTGSHGYLSDPVISTDSFTYTGDFDTEYTLEWQIGPLGGNGGGWIIVTTTVPPEAEPQYGKAPWDLLGLSAVITTSTPGVSVGNPQGEEGDSVSVMVVGPALRISKAYDPLRVRPGRLLTYTLMVENQERDDAIPANGIVITDPFPANTSFVTASGTGFFSPTAEGGLVIWTPPDPLAPAGSLAVTFTARVTNSFPSCPPSKIINGGYIVGSEETIRTVVGKTKSTAVIDVLEKTIQAPSLPVGPKTVFPGGTVTYTISIYNPLHDAPLNVALLTDTLPGTPNPFTYVDMVNGDPPAVISGSHVIWQDLSVGAGGVTTFSFHAQVPYHIDIPVNKTHRVYLNDVAAFAPGLNICPMNDKDPSTADVTRQIWVDKTVYPTHVLSGELVTYTITLENFGDTPINFIRLTDTLPHLGGADFYFVRMLSGPDPVAEYRHNPVVWYPLSVPAFGQVALSFQAKAIGWPLTAYGNSLSASAPQTTIPARENIAKVTIDSPLTIGKVVDPTATFVEERVTYTVTVCNVATGTYTLDEFRDYLPTGFYPADLTSGSPYVIDISPPVELPAGECWEHAFEVDVSVDVGCGIDVKNGAMEVDIIDPVVATFGVPAGQAPLKVNPHVTLDKDRDHEVVLYDKEGETVVYTVTLNNASHIPIDPVTVEDTLPEGFEFVGMVVGDTPVQTDPTIKWENQVIPSYGQLVLVFRAGIPVGLPPGEYTNQVVATPVDDLVCFEEEAKVKVRVVTEIIELSKVASPSEVPPLGIVQYEIRLKNIDSIDVTDTVVTESLPVGLPGQEFQFVGMETGYPEPSEISGQTVVWRDLTVPALTTLKLRFDAQAPILFGTYPNSVTVSCERDSDVEPKNPWDIEAPVVVLPGVLMDKTASPTEIKVGGIVVYTITLYNGWTSALEDVRITDTLPAGFMFRQMLDGDLPDSRSPLVWELDQVKKGAQELVFEVGVGLNTISGTHYNNVAGYSPSALIPAVEDGAPVYVIAGDTWSVYLPFVLKDNM